MFGLKKIVSALLIAAILLSIPFTGALAAADGQNETVVALPTATEGNAATEAVAAAQTPETPSAAPVTVPTQTATPAPSPTGTDTLAAQAALPAAANTAQTDDDGIAAMPEEDGIAIMPEEDGIAVMPEEDGITQNPEDAAFDFGVGTYDDSFGCTFEIRGTSAVITGVKNRDAEVVVIPNYIYVPAAYRYYPVTEITNGAFSGMKNLRGMELYTVKDQGYYLNSIGENAFLGCDKLSYANLPYSVTQIGAAAFSGCKALAEIRSVDTFKDEILINQLPYYLGQIENSLFEGCELLEVIQIPSRVSKIGDLAFFGCTSLHTVKIYSYFVNFGTDVFYKKENDSAVGKNKELTIYCAPNTTAQDYAKSNEIPFKSDGFDYGSTNYYFIEGADGITITKYVGTQNGAAALTYEQLNPVVPSRLAGQNVIKIDKNAFQGTPINSVTIPEGVLEIDDSAFSDCSSLTAVNLPSTLKTIGEFSFENCAKLVSINLPANVTSIGRNAFERCNLLTSFTLPQKLTEVPISMFAWCNSLSEITLPNTITKIKPYAFSYCSGLKKIYIPESVTEIGYGAFKEAPNTIIYGRENSAAQTYAAKNNIPFIAAESLAAGPQLLPPGNLNAPVAGITTNSAALAWNTAPGASGYKLERSADNNTFITVYEGAAAYFTNTSLSPDTKYYYRVCAYAGDGAAKQYGAYSSVLELNTRPGAPAMPTGLRVVFENGAFKLTWNEVPGAYGYFIMLSSNGRNYDSISDTESRNTTATISELAPNFNYTFGICAYRKYNNEDYIVGSMGAPVGAVGGIDYVNSYDVTHNSATLTWGSMAGASGYELQRSTDGNAYSTVYTGAALTYKNNALYAGVDYYYRVRAYRVVGANRVYSAFSEPHAIKTNAIDPPPAPGGAWHGAVTYYTAALYWPGVGGVNGYELLRSTDGVNYAPIYAGTALSFNNTGLSPATRYYYKVRTYKLNGAQRIYSDTNAPTEVNTPQLPPPGRPVGLTRSGVTYSSATLAWRGVSGANGYELFRICPTAPNSQYTLVYDGRGTSFVDSTLEDITRYDYFVRAYKISTNNVRVYSDNSAVVVVTTGRLPATRAPYGLRVSDIGINGVTVSWPAIDGAHGYILERSVDNRRYAQVYAGDAPAYRDEGLAAYTRYYYRARAYRYGKGGYQVFSGYSPATNGLTYQIPAPAVPSELNAPAVNPYDITLNWKPAEEGGVTFEIWRSTDNRRYYFLKAVGGNAYTDINLYPATYYYYKIRAYKVSTRNIKVYSAFSAPLTIQTNPPVPPVSITASRVTYNSALISWTPSLRASGYWLERSTDNINYTRVYSGGARSVTIRGLEAVTEYYFRVRAYRVVGRTTIFGDYTQPITIKTAQLPPPGIPSGIRISGLTQNSATISWRGVAYSNGYEISRTTDNVNFTNVYDGARAAFTDQGLDVFTTCYYHIRAYRNTREGKVYSIRPAIVRVITRQIPAPSIPGRIGFSNITDNSMTISWPAAPGAHGYMLERSTDNRRYTEIYSGDQPYFTDTGMAAYTRYYYRVRPFTWSRDIKVIGRYTPVGYTPTQQIPAPAVPSELNASNINPYDMTLNWSPAQEGGVVFELWRSTDNRNYSLIKTLGENAYTDVKLVPGINYYYKMRAYKVSTRNIKVYSAFSAPITTQTQPPVAPAYLSPGAITSNSLGVSWPVSPGASGYQLERSTNGTDFMPIYTGTGRSFITRNLAPATDYYFRVRAYRQVGRAQNYGDYSQVIKLTTK